MNLVEHVALLLVLVIARVTAFVSTFPLFRSAMIPLIVKVSLSVALSCMWLWMLWECPAGTLPDSLPTNWLGTAVCVARESAVGAILGYLLGLLFLPAQIAGSYLGQELGFNMPGVVDPTTDASNNVYGDLLSALGTLIFFAVDAHQLAIGALFSSFQSLPVGQPLPTLSPFAASEGLSLAHRWGLELAAPLGCGLFLVTVTNALLMKISPQLNLFSVGIPVRLLLGLLAAMVMFPETADILRRIYLQQELLIRRLGV